MTLTDLVGALQNVLADLRWIKDASDMFDWKVALFLSFSSSIDLKCYKVESKIDPQVGIKMISHIQGRSTKRKYVDCRYWTPY